MPKMVGVFLVAVATAACGTTGCVDLANAIHLGGLEAQFSSVQISADTTADVDVQISAH